MLDIEHEFSGIILSSTHVHVNHDMCMEVLLVRGEGTDIKNVTEKLMTVRIRTAQKTRCFDIWNKKVPRKWTLEQGGYTISSLFIRSYEQGERTYQSMLCRGYNAEVPVYIGKKALSFADFLVLVLTIGVIAVAQLTL